MGYTERREKGDYPYRVTPIQGYQLAAYAGTLSVSGASALRLLWTTFTFSVTATEAGLPGGTPWSFEVNSTAYRSTNLTLVVGFPNGTFSYTAEVASGYAPSTSSGTFVVDDAPTAFTVSYSVEPGFLVGTVTPAGATLTVNGTPNIVGADGAFNISLTPGNYRIEAALTGYQAFYANETISPATAAHLTIAMTKVSTAPSNATQNNLNSNYLFVGVGVAVAIAAAVALIVLARRRAGP